MPNSPNSLSFSTYSTLNLQIKMDKTVFPLFPNFHFYQRPELWPKGSSLLSGVLHHRKKENFAFTSGVEGKSDSQLIEIEREIVCV